MRHKLRKHPSSVLRSTNLRNEPILGAGRDRTSAGQLFGGPVLQNHVETPVVERPPRGGGDPRDPLALAAGEEIERAMVAVGVIAALAEQGVRGPGAATEAVL